MSDQHLSKVMITNPPFPLSLTWTAVAVSEACQGEGQQTIEMQFMADVVNLRKL
jgi:hypothetical protein